MGSFFSFSQKDEPDSNDNAQPITTKKDIYPDLKKEEIMYDIRRHKEYPQLIKQFEKECGDKSNMLQKIDDLNKQILDLRLNLKYFDVPNSKEYKELLYKYNKDVPKIYLPKQYPTSRRDQNHMQQREYVKPDNMSQNPKYMYDITDWQDSSIISSTGNNLKLINNVDTYPYS